MRVGAVQGNLKVNNFFFLVPLIYLALFQLPKAPCRIGEYFKKNRVRARDVSPSTFGRVTKMWMFFSLNQVHNLPHWGYLAHVRIWPENLSCHTPGPTQTTARLSM